MLGFGEKSCWVVGLGGVGGYGGGGGGGGGAQFLVMRVHERVGVTSLFGRQMKFTSTTISAESHTRVGCLFRGVRSPCLQH